MVRVGGVSYAIDVRQGRGRRISDLRVAGRPLDPDRRYRTTRWASTGEADGPAAYDVVADYLRAVKRLRVEPRNRVRVL
jgi:sulfur-oxidizing protein SoxB